MRNSSPLLAALFVLSAGCGLVNFGDDDQVTTDKPDADICSQVGMYAAIGVCIGKAPKIDASRPVDALHDEAISDLAVAPADASANVDTSTAD